MSSPLKRVYDAIYKAGPDAIHPRKGRLSEYGSQTSRNDPHVRWITKNVPIGSRVLDASCGLGSLALTLKAFGYEVEGTEFSQWLVINKLQDIGFPVHHLSYQDIDRLPEESFDLVVSNDVLEHLPSEMVVRAAVNSLLRLSRKYIAISVGLKKHLAAYPEAVGMGKEIGSLHLFCPGVRWWNRFFHKKIGVKATDKRGSDSFYIFGVKR